MWWIYEISCVLFYLTLFHEFVQSYSFELTITLSRSFSDAIQTQVNLIVDDGCAKRCTARCVSRRRNWHKKPISEQFALLLCVNSSIHSLHKYPSTFFLYILFFQSPGSSVYHITFAYYIHFAALHSRARACRRFVHHRNLYLICWPFPRWHRLLLCKHRWREKLTFASSTSHETVDGIFFRLHRVIIVNAPKWWEWVKIHQNGMKMCEHGMKLVWDCVGRMKMYRNMRVSDESIIIDRPVVSTLDYLVWPLDRLVPVMSLSADIRCAPRNNNIFW